MASNGSDWKRVNGRGQMSYALLGLVMCESRWGLWRLRVKKGLHGELRVKRLVHSRWQSRRIDLLTRINSKSWQRRIPMSGHGGVYKRESDVPRRRRW